MKQLREHLLSVTFCCDGTASVWNAKYELPVVHPWARKTTHFQCVESEFDGQTYHAAPLPLPSRAAREIAQPLAPAAKSEAVNVPSNTR